MIIAPPFLHSTLQLFDSSTLQLFNPSTLPAPGTRPTRAGKFCLKVTGLDRFGIAIFNSTLGTVVHHTLDSVETVMDKALSEIEENGFSFIGITDTVRWTPTAVEWAAISTDIGTYHWIIYAGDFTAETVVSSAIQSGPYWSDVKAFKIIT